MSGHRTVMNADYTPPEYDRVADDLFARRIGKARRTRVVKAVVNSSSTKREVSLDDVPEHFF
ncbi:MAG: hypothetical protein AAFQ42_06320 [Pseudomonadota bacterium]